jgi:hypothetical protein
LSSALSFFNQGTNMPASSPCGIGGPSNPGGPCTGVLNPSDAGSGAFAGLSVSPAIAGVIAAGAILAFLIFTVWAVRKVGTFFDSNRRANLSLAGEPGTMEWDDKFWNDRGQEDRARREDADFGDLSDAEDDTEDDTEDDAPALESGVQRLGHDS